MLKKADAKLIFLVIVVLFLDFPLHAKEDPTILKPVARVQNCQTVLARFAPMAGVLISIAAIPITVTRIQSARVGAPYIGYGIYFDWDRIIDHFSYEEKKLLNDPKNNEEAVVKILTSRLFGGIADDDGRGGTINWSNLILHPNKIRYASEYLDPQVKDRGVCRHKAAILYEMCNRLGIKATLEQGWAIDPETKEPFSHVFVYIKDLDKIADPMNDEFMDASAYRKLYSVSKEHNYDLERKLLGTYTP